MDTKITEKQLTKLLSEAPEGSVALLDFFKYAKKIKVSPELMTKLWPSTKPGEMIWKLGLMYRTSKGLVKFHRVYCIITPDQLEDWYDH